MIKGETIEIKKIITEVKAPKKFIDGVYIEAELDVKSKSKIKEFSKSIGIETPFDDYHTTVIYSKKEVSEDILEKIRYFYPKKIVIYGAVVGYEKFINEEEDIYAVVLKVECPKLKALHEKLMKDFPLIYDYDEYIAHITLTYKGKDIDIKKLEVPNFEVKYNKLNIEPLNIDWAKEVE